MKPVLHNKGSVRKFNFGAKNPLFISYLLADRVESINQILWKDKLRAPLPSLPCIMCISLSLEARQSPTNQKSCYKEAWLRACQCQSPRVHTPVKAWLHFELAYLPSCSSLLKSGSQAPFEGRGLGEWQGDLRLRRLAFGAVEIHIRAHLFPIL